MSRDGGFPRADVDVGLLDDPKVRQLVRSTRDEGLVARCLVAFVATLLASWDAGERVALEDAAPLWLTALDDVGQRLRSVDLLDDEGRIRAGAWDSWFAKASGRRQAQRDRWERSNKKRRTPSKRGHDDVAARLPRGHDGEPRPSVVGLRPTDGTQPPPAVAEAPASAATDRVEAFVAEPEWWPKSGPKPTTWAEAKANAEVVRRQIAAPSDGRRRQAEALLRELAPSNGVGHVARRDDGTIWCNNFRAHGTAHRDVSSATPICDRCETAPAEAHVL